MICGLQLLMRRPLGISCHISGEQVSGLAYPESLGCLEHRADFVNRGISKME